MKSKLSMLDLIISLQAGNLLTVTNLKFNDIIFIGYTIGYKFMISLIVMMESRLKTFLRK